MSNLGKKSIYIISVGILMFAFLNCGEAFDDGASSNSSLSSQNCDENCLNKNSANIELRIGEGADIQIMATQQYFNISGDCNEGNYSENDISWELYRSGSAVGFGSGSQCKDGRFHLLVDLGASSKGLFVNGSKTVRLVHELVVELSGVDSGEKVKNIALAKRLIQLIPN